MMFDPVPVTYDNRSGSKEFAYGFVYFNDHQRVGYTTADGVVADATGGWDPITSAQVKEAEDFLKREGVLK